MNPAKAGLAPLGWAILILFWALGRALLTILLYLVALTLVFPGKAVIRLWRAL